MRLDLPRRLSGLTVISALLLAACAPATSQQSTTPPGGSGSSTTGGVAPAPTSSAKPFTIKIGVGSSTSQLDPQASIGNNPRWYGQFETLVAQDENGKLQPWLATDWKNVNPTTWQFTLDTSRKFSDGNPITINDVKYSYDRALDPTLKLGIATRLLTLDKTEVVDSKTFNVITKVPDPLLVKRVALVVILQRAYVEKMTPAEFAVKPQGSGPYMLKEFVPNDHYRLVQNPYYPNKPYAAEVIVRAVPEVAARVAGLRTGELDIVTGITMDSADSLKAGGFQIVSFNQGRSQGAFLFTNLADQPTSNKLVRQALNYAVDKDTMAKTVFRGYTKPEAGQIVQATTVGYNPNIKAYTFDPEKAKQLLAQAGYPNGIKIKADLSTSYVEYQATWLYVQSQWKAIGVDLELNFMSDSAAWLDRWYGRVQRSNLLSVSLLNSPAMDAEFALTWFKGSTPEPQRFYKNPAFDDPYNAALTEMNEAKRTDNLQKAIAAMFEDPPYLFLVEGFDLWAVSTDLLNVRPRGDQEARMDIIQHK